MSPRAPLTAALALVALAAAAPAQASSSCRPQIIDLGTLPGSERSVALGVNGQGVVVGYDDDGADFQDLRAVRWLGGRAQDLGLPGPGLAFDVNEAGTVVGDYDTGSARQAYMWRDGRLTALSGLRNGRGAIARHISDTGIVVGTASDADGVDHAAIWILGRIVDLGIPRGYRSSWGFDVSNTGDVVGDVDDGSRAVPYRWRLGHFQLLPPFGIGAFGVGLAPGGVTAGTSFMEDGTHRATVWDRFGRAHWLGHLGRGNSADILGSDGAGGFVGGASLDPGGPPTVFVARVGEPLKTMRALSGNLGPSNARGLHRNGYAAGSSETSDRKEHATLWTCVWKQAFVPKP